MRPRCPNNTNFTYETPPVDLHYRDVEVAPHGTIREIGDELHFVVGRKEQIANFRRLLQSLRQLRHILPEWDGPYLKKPNFFGSRESFDAAANHDGFLLEGEPGNFALHGRIAGVACRLQLAADRHVLPHDDGTITPRNPTADQSASPPHLRGPRHRIASTWAAFTHWSRADRHY